MKADFDSRFINWMFAGLFALTVIRNAWMTDDAYITLRTVENFLAGYGLTYNPFERVQAYTHPLWLFLLSGGYFLQYKLLGLQSNNGLYLLTLGFSILLSSAAVAWVWRGISSQRLENKALFLAAVIMSKAFVDYSTSGLENALTYLLLAAFLYLFVVRPASLFWLSGVSAALALNRLDIILLVLPALGYRFIAGRANLLKNLRDVLLGFSPVLLWEVFALFYYGFPFPNTAYAKLNTGIGESLLLAQGLDYLFNSLGLDPVTLSVILLAGASVLIQKDRTGQVLYAGVGLYLLYILRIGGDFMTGRFLTAPFLVSAVLLARSQAFSRQTVLTGALLLALVGLTSPRPPLFGLISPPTENFAEFRDDFGVDDEKMVYFTRSGLVLNGFRGQRGGSRFAGANWVLDQPVEVVVEDAIGLFGYQKGPGVYVIDPVALVDPLLARLPVADKINWRIGHFRRDIPAGYLETIEAGENLIEHPALAEYYDRLSGVVSGPLWDGERLEEVWKFNTGQNDALLHAYLESVDR